MITSLFLSPTTIKKKRKYSPNQLTWLLWASNPFFFVYRKSQFLHLKSVFNRFTGTRVRCSKLSLKHKEWKLNSFIWRFISVETLMLCTKKLIKIRLQKWLTCNSPCKPSKLTVFLVTYPFFQNSRLRENATIDQDCNGWLERVTTWNGISLSVLDRISFLFGRDEKLARSTHRTS